MSALITLLLWTLSITASDAARILAFFPTPSISHQVVFRPLTQELARRGHEVTVITPNPAFPIEETPENLTEIDVHDLSYEKWQTLYKLTSGDTDSKLLLRISFLMLIEVVEMQLKADVVQKVLKEEKFDLLLLEACSKPALLFSHVVKVPVILVSSFGPMNLNVPTFGLAWNPLLYPDSLSKRLYNKTTKWDKLTDLWNFFEIQYIMYEVEVAENDLAIKMFGPNAPTINELKNNVHLLFLNTYPIWEGKRPVPPSVVFMGGIHQIPVKKLPADIQTYLDSSENGVIYLSFGSNVQPSLLPPERVQLMVKFFSQLPHDVLWKWDTDELPGRSENIRISKWVPQSDLLRHPKVKAFIKQGGLQSIDESITGGVPLICVPMFGDQWYHAEKYVDHKIGVQINWMSLTEEDFKNAINTIIDDNSYRQNIIRLGSIMRDQPQPALERVVWWTEHVLRHGGSRHLRPPATMSWAQYLILELLLTLFGIIVSLILVLSLIVHSLRKVYL